MAYKDLARGALHPLGPEFTWDTFRLVISRFFIYTFIFFIHIRHLSYFDC